MSTSGSTPQSAIKVETAIPEAKTPAEAKEDTPKTNHELAWDYLMDDKSWIIASEKSDVLNERLGISCWEDLAFLNSQEIEELMGKLKTVPARKFEAFMR